MTDEEVADLEPAEQNRRQEIAAQYDDLLRDCSVNDLVELELEPDERRQTVIARLKSAAARRDVRLEFGRSREPLLLRFTVRDIPRLAPAAPAVTALALEDYEASDQPQPTTTDIRTSYGRRGAPRSARPDSGARRFAGRPGSPFREGRPAPQRDGRPASRDGRQAAGRPGAPRRGPERDGAPQGARQGRRPGPAQDRAPSGEQRRRPRRRPR